MEPIRQLSAILFTDIVGYSAMMGRDESKALTLLEKSRQIQRPLVQKYQGRWVKDLGDGAILIFTSVLNALECALDIQKGVRNIEGLQLKVALHSGEIILREGDVFGDGVNIAARIEQLCTGNSILLSEKAHREIRNIHTIETLGLGEFSFKNIEEPVGLFAVVSGDLSVPDLTRSSLLIQHAENDKEVRSVDQQFEDKLRNLIRDNLGSPKLSVAFLCKKMGCSRPKLYRKVQALAGQSPSELIRNTRLQQAAELLKQGAGNISEVAYETGFNNLSYFSKTFLERFGDTPSAYAKKQQARSRIEVPVALSQFIGREKEIAEISGLLDRARLLTLTGTGGTGKTRLTTELLRSLGDRFRDGAWFVPLAPIGVPEQVLPKIAQVLKIQQDPAKSTIDILIEYFAEKEVLLALDNFEHVLPAAPLIRKMLTACPGLKVLVTSRVVLNLTGEQEYVVPQLSLPEAGRAYSIEELGAFHAVELFLNRVQEVKPGFRMTDGNKTCVQAICCALDGLPLALELAAARIKLFPPEALFKRLTNNLDILKSNAPDMTERHRTLVNAIDWSYGLLSPQEQTMFRRLAVFSGGFTIEAAEEVCLQDYAGQVDMLEIISNLLDKSLLQQQEQPDGEPRFIMLETIKAFGQERLRRSLEFETNMERYAVFFQRKMATAEKELTGPEMTQWLDYIEWELDNLRAIFLWIEKKQASEKGLRFAVSFWRYWTIRSMMREGAGWLKRMLDIPAVRKDTVLRCKVLNAYGMLFGLTQRILAAIPIFSESLRIARQIEYKPGIGQALTYLSWAYNYEPVLEKCDVYSKEALAIHQELGNKRSQAATLNNMAYMDRTRGDLKQSLELYGQAAGIMQSIGENRGNAYSNCWSAWVLTMMGQQIEASRRTKEALSIFKELDDKQLIAFGLSVLAFIMCYNREFDEIDGLIDKAMPLWERSGNSYGEMMLNIIQAMCYLSQGDLEQANDLLNRFEKKFHFFKTYIFWSRQLRTRLYIMTSDLDAGLACARQNFLDACEKQIGLLLPDNLSLCAQILAGKKVFQPAISLFSFSEKVRVECGIAVPPIWQADHNLTLAMLKKAVPAVTFEGLWRKGKSMTREDIPAMLDLH